jgi:hypothetical protein
VSGRLYLFPCAKKGGRRWALRSGSRVQRLGQKAGGWARVLDCESANASIL